jgi:predicted O-methyltransferase YrrM
MSVEKALSWAYCEEFAPQDEVLTTARERAAQVGALPVSPATGALLQVLAATTRARAVVEVGTGTGVGSLYLLRGMPDDGVLTTIDVEAEHQRWAKHAFADDGVRPARTRTICGRAQDVLPRLTDAGYDLVVIDADLDGLDDYVEQAVRLLRPGGVLAVDHALWRDQVADPARRDEATTMVREIDRSVRADDRLTCALLPAGDGVLVAVRR